MGDILGIIEFYLESKEGLSTREEGLSVIIDPKIDDIENTGMSSVLPMIFSILLILMTFWETVGFLIFALKVSHYL